MTQIRFAAAAWVAFVVALLTVHMFFPQRSGPLAITEIFEPYIAITGLLAAIVAFNVRPPVTRAAALGLVAILVVRCGPALVSAPGPGAGTELNVMTWNVLYDDAAERTLSGVLESRANLVGLEELQPDAVAALESDEQVQSRLPYRALEPEAGVRGVGLLSAFPIVEHQTSTEPPFMRAVIQPPAADAVTVFVVHPLPARITMLSGIPVGLEPNKRDADIALIRSRVDEDLAAGRQVILMGDINTTEREPAYFELARGLKDAHIEAGIGPGLTWRSPWLRVLPFGVLRIDYIFASPTLTVTSSTVDCALASDHCRVQATIFTGAQR